MFAAFMMLTNSLTAESTLANPNGDVTSATPIRLRSREVYFTSPGKGVRAEGQAFYVRRDGVEMMRYHTLQSQSDKMAAMERSFSDDNGKTWSKPEPLELTRKVADGVERNGYKAGWVDPVNGNLLVMGGKAVTPTDTPREVPISGGMWYRVSTDGGRTYAVAEQLIQDGKDSKGDPFTPTHPMEGVWNGRNSAQFGDRTGRPIRTRGGNVLQPIQMTLAGDDPGDKPLNPGGGYTYTEVAVLIGAWLDGGKMKWQLSNRVTIPPDKSSRGLIEPTVAELPDGRILMVMRGSNTKTTPGRKWFSMSSDGGFTWSDVEPWGYSDGGAFFSPSSCSQLLPHSNGQIYWLGNITPKPPQGNLPRYPFVCGRVDLKTGLLIRSSVTKIDDKGEDDNDTVTLSNFMAIEDRVSHDILLFMSRPFAKTGFTSDAYLYRIEVGR